MIEPEPPKPAAPTPHPPPPPKGSPLTSMGEVLVVLGVLAGLGAVIAGIVLIAHSVPVCSTNPYDNALLDCSQRRHDLVGLGIATMVGGLLQAMTMVTLGRVATVLAEVRAFLIPAST